MDGEPLVKYSHPTMFDKEAAGTIYRCMNDSKDYDYFIQVNSNQDAPQWERVGTILEKAFEDFYSNGNFVTECLRLYSHQQEKPLVTITKIIQDQHPKMY